jgi:dTDP-4-dehydrorhamnose reductase
VIVVTGASGQLGTAFRNVFDDARFLTRAEFDLAHADLDARLADLHPSAIINCAAFTAVDAAESEESTAFQINAEAVATMAAFAARSGIPFVTFSSDYVFDGSATTPYVESSPTAPINAYGRTKLAGEHAALQVHPGALVIRTSWVVSGTHPNFVATMLRLSADRDEVRVVADQRGCPTIADDLALGTAEALLSGASGVLHITNQGATTWFDLARRTVELAGRHPEIIQPCATADYPTEARRPAYSVLGSERRHALGLAALPSWQDSLAPVVAAQLDRLK